MQEKLRLNLKYFEISATNTILSRNKECQACLMLLCCFLHTRKGTVTGIAFIDSTPIRVCAPARAHAHKVFKGRVNWGKNSVGWHFGFKLHLIINDRGDLLAFKLTPANTDDFQLLFLATISKISRRSRVKRNILESLDRSIRKNENKIS